MGGATNSNNTSILNLSGGTFTASGSFIAMAAGNTSTAAISISGTADVTLPAFPTARGTGSTATITFDGGVLKPTAASATYMGGLTSATIQDGGAKFEVATGKDITITQALLTHGTSLGGGLTKAGVGKLTLSGVNTYTGATVIQDAGTLALDATGTINASSGVDLGTAGTFDVSAKSGYSVANLNGSGDVIGALTVSTALAIGNSPGTIDFSAGLTLGNSSTYNFELVGGTTGANSADLGNVNGLLTIGTGVILDLAQFGAGAYTLNDKFTLFSYDTLSGTFNGLADGAQFTDAGGIWQINYNDTVGTNGGSESNFVTITAIPEPEAALLGGLGLLGILRRRRN